MMGTRKLRFGATATTIASALLAMQGCSGDPPGEPDELEARETSALENGETTPISQLPAIDGTSNTVLVGELLGKPTRLGETTALHVRLPPPINPQLATSLVRVVGPAASPQVLFRTDALVQLGMIKTSPGKEFFTAFATLPREQLDTLKQNLQEIASGRFGETTTQSVVFDGRQPLGRAVNPTIDPSQFIPGGGFIPINRCSIRPVSTAAAWGKSLFITDPSVILNGARTWDPCTGAGTQGGAWTFAHLMREMANGSGSTPENFVKDWLSLWLNTQPINFDNVASRTQMFNQVIRPWEAASGGVATLLVDATGKLTVNLTRPLNLDIAPFRLNAIVNRIDLGETATGPAGYSGGITSLPKTPGELRFIFNVVQPNPWGPGGSEATCGKKLFTTIFEYGVPGNTCASVVAWARQWTQLQAFPGFTAPYLTQLEAMTESVVRHGAAPLKGNQNAINQIRTNEIALGTSWELREFALATENFAIPSSTPASGPLRPHSVALTPNDGAFPPLGPNATVNSFVTTTVAAGVKLPVVLPTKCDASYIVPGSIAGVPFLGGNTLIGAGHWNTTTVSLASSAILRCARHLFSLNTCGGCHRDESGTNGLGGSTSFTHITAASPIPVGLSKFLTGGGPGLLFNVADPQLGAPTWQFADLERRFQRLFDLSHCTSCVTRFTFGSDLVTEMDRNIGMVPVDPRPGEVFPVKTGPITELAAMQKVMDMRGGFMKGPIDDTVDAVRAVQAISE